MSDKAQTECVVVGAGVIGLAIARALAKAGREVIVLERHAAIGLETSSRNSEVIHAGIYYPQGSLKARACVEGRALLYRYLDEHKLPHRRCGKLIVATTQDEAVALEDIEARARANGVRDIERVSGAWARELEPALNCVAALHSPSTGIIDARAYMLSLRGELEDHGGMIALSSPLIRAEVLSDGFELHVGGGSPMQLKTKMLVNSAGLWAPATARRIDGLDPAHVPQEFFARGNYFALAGRSPFSRLIYPVPERAGLGVHLTLDMGTQARFGPDVEWLNLASDNIDYRVDPARADNFYAAIRRYWPALPDGALTPAFSGVRPKTAPESEAAQDFIISGPRQHGVPGLVNLYGIESPGLTASLALAEEVRRLL
jgi:L-2-hydroxyglutarate oxidase LhgO